MLITPYGMVTLMEILEHKAEAFCRLSSILGQAMMILRMGTANDNTLRQLAGALGEIQRESQRLNLGLVEKHVERIREEWVGKGIELTSHSLDELYNRLRDALEERLFLAVPSELAIFYQQTTPLFGEAVDNAFPGTIVEDVSEAGKCLALGRGTATVFHLMRVLEAAVHRLGEKLGVTVVDKHNADLEWGKILANMKTPIEAMAKGKSKDDWSEAFTMLVHVKQAWRNPTMHPKQTYTAEEAKAIFEAVRVFMRHLASLV